MRYSMSDQNRSTAYVLSTQLWQLLVPQAGYNVYLMISALVWVAGGGHLSRILGHLTFPSVSPGAARRQSGGSQEAPLGLATRHHHLPRLQVISITLLHCLWCGQTKCTHLKWISSMRASKGQNMLKILLVYLKLSILRCTVIRLLFLSIFKHRMHQF